MKIVYVVGGLLAPNGMSSVLSAKINYLAEHTDYELYICLGKGPEGNLQKWGSPVFFILSDAVLLCPRHDFRK